MAPRHVKTGVLAALLAGLALIVPGLPVSAGQLIEVGQVAPAFEMMSDRDETVRLDRYRKKWVLLAFYPKAFTPG